MPEPSSAAKERSARTGFASGGLDRLSAIRDDPEAVAQLRHDPAARSVIIVTDRPMLRLGENGHVPFFSLREVADLGDLRAMALLGRDTEGPVFAALLDDAAVVLHDRPADGSLIDRRTVVVPGRDDLVLLDMRAVAMQGLVNPTSLGMLGQAKSLMHWHVRHRHCANCGAATRIAAAGWRRECDSCQAHHFPRTDPVVIMLAVAGERCLLGRQPRFPRGMYSALAGFIESGETVEDAVRREIGEEAGIATATVRYLASQPWPFPATLMIGCLAQAISTAITVDTTELEDARWFGREEAIALLGGRHPDALSCPPATAIAHTILRAWALEGETP